jgi:Transposase DDE domain group 1
VPRNTRSRSKNRGPDANRLSAVSLRSPGTGPSDRSNVTTCCRIPSLAASVLSPARPSPSRRSTNCRRPRAFRYAIRLPANEVLQRRISYLLTPPVGRPPNKPVVSYASFHYQTDGWTRARRVVAKVEWHQGELYPRIGFIATNLTRPNKCVVKRRHRRAAHQGGKKAFRWTRLSCSAFRHNAVRIQLHAPRLQPRQFPAHAGAAGGGRAVVLTTLCEKLAKIGARIVHHGRYVVFKLAEVAARALFAEILLGSRGSGRGHFRHDGEALGVSITAREVRPRSLLGSLDATVRGYRRAEKQRGAPRITSSVPQGLVARTHGEHDGCCGTGIWEIGSSARVQLLAGHRG